MTCYHDSPAWDSAKTKFSFFFVIMYTYAGRSFVDTLESLAAIPQ